MRAHAAVAALPDDHRQAVRGNRDRPVVLSGEHGNRRAPTPVSGWAKRGGARDADQRDSKSNGSVGTSWDQRRTYS